VIGQYPETVLGQGPQPTATGAVEGDMTAVEGMELAIEVDMEVMATLNDKEVGAAEDAAEDTGGGAGDEIARDSAMLIVSRPQSSCCSSSAPRDVRLSRSRAETSFNGLAAAADSVRPSRLQIASANANILGRNQTNRTANNGRVASCLPAHPILSITINIGGNS
jgi:hypothetical protein